MKKGKEQFFRKTYQLLEAGLSLRSILEGLRESDGKEAAKVNLVIHGLDQGLSLADALKSLYKLSSHEELMLRTAQTTGRLNETLKALSQFNEKSGSFKKEIRKTLIRPAVTLVLAISILVMVVKVVIPQITNALPFDNKPFLLEIMVTVGNSFPQVATVMLIGSALLAVLSIVSPTLFSRMMMSIPILGSMSRFKSINSFLTVMTLLCSGGIRVSDALTMALLQTNPYVKRKLRVVLPELNRGVSLKNALGATSLFPFYVIELMDTAEQTAQYPKYFGEASRLVEQDFEDNRNAALPLVEMGALILVGSVIVLTFLSIIIPIQKMGLEAFGAH